MNELTKIQVDTVEQARSTRTHKGVSPTQSGNQSAGAASKRNLFCKGWLPWVEPDPRHAQARVIELFTAPMTNHVHLEPCAMRCKGDLKVDSALPIMTSNVVSDDNQVPSDDGLLSTGAAPGDSDSSGAAE